MRRGLLLTQIFCAVNARCLQRKGITMNDFIKKRLVVTKAHADIVLSLLFILASLYMLLFGIEKFTKIGFGAVGKVDDRLFPTILMWAALICSIAILLFALFENAKDKKLIQASGTPATTEFSICAILVTLIGLFFYLTMKTIGYPLSSVISICAVYYLLGGRKILTALLTSGIFTLVCYLFFAVYLGVSLPIGFGF